MYAAPALDLLKDRPVIRYELPADPATIAYNIQNLRVAWARLEMPLSSWQTGETADPTAGPLSDKVRQAMEMARTLAQKKIPMIISDWSAPGWAVATGTGAGDTQECAALRQVFGDSQKTFFNNAKSYIGHTMGAAGALELAGNLLAFEDRVCHPTINVDRLDPECALTGLVINEPREVGPVDYILNNSFGMLGINSVVIVKRI